MYPEILAVITARESAYLTAISKLDEEAATFIAQGNVVQAVQLLTQWSFEEGVFLL